MTEKPPTSPQRGRRLMAGCMAALAALVAACKGPPAVQESLPGDAPTSVSPTINGVQASAATSARAYRQDAATHLYGLNAERIHHGKLPAQLYAIGVLEVSIDRAGRVQRLHWLRAPRHAPEVVTEIERTVRAAAPFPAPARMGKVVYTDTWLWNKTGEFQLDTLTEGQL